MITCALWQKEIDTNEEWVKAKAAHDMTRR